MIKVLQLTCTLNSGSVGRIAEDIGRLANQNGFDSYFGYGSKRNESQLKAIQVGSNFDMYIHAIESRLFDNHGFSSKYATLKFIEKVKEINPDIIHLHNAHGYYINIEVLFNYIRERNIQLVWTLHDCWPLTGHCSFFDMANCEKWKKQCHNCPNTHKYPASLFFDFSTRNYELKKALFSNLKNVTIVTPSVWLSKIVKQSFLSNYLVEVINNGIDLNAFKPMDTLVVEQKYSLKNKKVILGVASVWDKRKGLADFIELSKLISSEKLIILVGLNKSQQKNLPSNIIGIARTENLNELATLYSFASVFVNPTYVDNFPTTNLEALACGTPVITYNTGGSPESVSEDTGFIVEKGDINTLLERINQILSVDKKKYSLICRERAEQLYDKNQKFLEYIHIYKQKLNLSE